MILLLSVDGTLHRQTEPGADHDAGPEKDSQPERNANQAREHTKTHKGCTRLIGITVRSTYPRKCRRRHFLGFNIRRYRNDKLLIKASVKAIKGFRQRLAREFRALRGANVRAVLAKIIPIVRGWVAYYRTVVSSRVFAVLSDYLWKLTFKWACWSHPNKPRRWIADRYYGKFNKFRNDRWVFGDRDPGAYLPKPAWTDIVRHTLVKGGASPDDPDLTRYWAQRRRKVKPPLDSYTVRLLSKQDGRCTLCGENLLIPDQPPQSPEGWEWWFMWVTRKAIKADYLVHHSMPNTPRDERTHLVHATCGRTGRHARTVAGDPVLQPMI